MKNRFINNIKYNNVFYYKILNIIYFCNKMFNNYVILYKIIDKVMQYIFKVLSENVCFRVFVFYKKMKSVYFKFQKYKILMIQLIVFIYLVLYIYI